MIVNSHEQLSRLREKMAGYVGQTFTEEMRQSIRSDAADIMHTAIDEGQAMMCRFACSNANTEHCPMNGYESCDWDNDRALQCHMDGGFEI